MIISFKSEIFQKTDKITQQIIASIFVKLMEREFDFINFNGLGNVFYDEFGKYCFNKNQICIDNLSPANSRLLVEYIEIKRKSTASKLVLSHLTNLVIGLDIAANEVLPKDALKILSERSQIIVENGINDWNFIKGLCFKYTNHIKRNPVYKLIKKAIDSERLESNNSGGNGELIKITEVCISSNRYQNIYKYKLMALFDSDRKYENGKVSETNYKHIIEFYKQKKITTLTSNDYKYDNNDLIIWHILHKRKIENYVPINVLQVKMPSSHFASLNKGMVELDYYDANYLNTGIGDIKNEIPKLFLYYPYSYKHLEERCLHHKEYSVDANEEISEIEVILLKIAKII